MRISLDNLDHDDGMVTITCDDQDAAREDQSIEGSHWECPGDMDIGYALVMDRPGLVADLEREGYEVDASDYWERDEKEWAEYRASIES